MKFEKYSLGRYGRIKQHVKTLPQIRGWVEDLIVLYAWISFVATVLFVLWG